MNSCHHDPPYFIASKPVAIKHRPAGDYAYLVHLLPASKNAKATRRLVGGSANYSTTMTPNTPRNERNETLQPQDFLDLLSFDFDSTPIQQPQGVHGVVDRVQLSSCLPPDGFTRKERNETVQHQDFLDLLSFDFDPTPIQQQGVHVVDRVQLSPWLPPDGFTVDFLRKLKSAAPSTESNDYRANRAATTSTPRSAASPRRKRSRKKKHTALLVLARTDEYSEAASSDSSYCSEEHHQKAGVLAPNQWAYKFQDLVKFQDAHGHCLVPHNWEGNSSLAHWVNNQRYQYKLRIESEHSNLTSEREEALERLGFVWNPRGSTWEERMDELASYVTDKGHANVPRGYPANPSLAVWVKCQRRQFKLFSNGVQWAMTKDRIMKLKELGFIFNPRSAAFSNAIIIMQTMHIILNALHIKRIDIILVGPHCCPQYTNAAIY
jgi:hypothetical protein